MMPPQQQRYPNQLNQSPASAARQQALARFYQMRSEALHKPQDYNVQDGNQAPAGVDTAMSWHPSWILNYVSQKIKDATGQ